MGIDGGFINSAIGVVREEGDTLTLLGYELFATHVGMDRVKNWKERKGDETVLSEILTETALWYLGILTRFDPEIVICESAAFRPSAGQRTSQVGEVRGVLHYLTLSHPALWRTVNPSSVKKHLTGKYRGGDKKEVQIAVSQYFEIPEFLNKGMDHICDALAGVIFFTEKIK
jgi:Holliday junction resolvasome RuvABC endonuclease subunit